MDVENKARRTVCFGILLTTREADKVPVHDELVGRTKNRINEWCRKLEFTCTVVQYMCRNVCVCVREFIRKKRILPRQWVSKEYQSASINTPAHPHAHPLVIDGRKMLLTTQVRTHSQEYNNTTKCCRGFGLAHHRSVSVIPNGLETAV